MKENIEEALEKLSDDTIIVCDMSIVQYDALMAYLLRRRQKLGYRVRYADGRLSIYEIPTTTHEIVAGHFDTVVIVYNMTHYGSSASPLFSLRSSTIYFPGARLEPDSCYRNRFVPRLQAPVDDRNILPNIIVEVGDSEPFDSIFGMPRLYFSTNHIRTVIIVKLIRSREGIYHMLSVLPYVVCTDRRHGDANGGGSISTGC
jgi:hypothetical protein